jgi:hypothetical protein
MKSFFISDRQDKEVLARFTRIVSIFDKQGHQVDKSQIVKSPQDDANDFEGAYKRNMTAIKKCDFLVAEVSNLSSGIGFLISTALTMKKPVLALYYKPSKHHLSTMLKGSTSNKLMFFKEYDDSNYEKVVKDFLNSVKSIIDTKFILIISPEIDRYLEWVSDNRRMHKAQVVRNAVEDIMKKDKDWKKAQV